MPFSRCGPRAASRLAFGAAALPFYGGYYGYGPGYGYGYGPYAAYGGPYYGGSTSEGVGSRMAMVIVCGGAYAFATKRVSTTGPIIRVIKDPEL